MSMTYYLSLDCETCGETMYEGLNISTLEHRGHPLLPLDLTASQVQFSCGNCGGVTYTGDIDDICFHEPGEVPEDEAESAEALDRLADQ